MRRFERTPSIAKVANFPARNGEHSEFDLDEIAGNQYQPAAVRREARRFVDDEVLQVQFRDALRISSRDLVNWHWPSEGIGSRALWTRNK